MAATLPISYYGGKQRLAPWIIPFIPKHTCYVEPFCGGAALYFKKPMPVITNTGHYREVLNDHDARLINFFKVLKYKFKDFSRLLEVTLYSEAEYHEAMQRMKTFKYSDDPDVYAALDYFINIRMSFSNTLGGGWSYTPAVGENGPSTFFKTVRDIKRFRDRFRYTFITRLGYQDSFRKWDSPSTFFYVDPPYINANQGHYAGYTEADTLKLIEILDSLQGSFILSTYDIDYLGMPFTWSRYEKQVRTSAAATTTGAQKEKRTEVIYKRGPKETPSQKVLDLYASGKYDCFKDSYGE